MEDQRTSLSLYAKVFSNLPTIGTRFLTFRDLPYLIKRYVDGTITLDYGCGPGHSTAILKSSGLDVEGMDINKYMINIAKHRDPSGTYTTINSGEIPREREKYDFVYAGYVLLHASTKHELLKIVKEIARVLKNNGTLIATVANENTYKYKWLVEDTDFEENKNLTSGSIKISKFPNITLYHYYWSEADYIEAFTKARLNLITIHKPLGKEIDNLPWITEKEISPSSMYVVRKMDSNCCKFHI